MKIDFDKASFKRFTRAIRRVVQAFFYVSVVGGLLCFLGFIVLHLIPEEYMKASANSGFSLSMDGLIRYRLLQPHMAMGGIYKAITLMAALLCIGLAFFLKQLHLILKTVEGDLPFDQANTNRLRLMGYILILFSLIVPAAGAGVASAMVNAFNLQNIMVVYSININLLLTGLLLLILSGIFRYGHYLQSEYDTTL